MRLTELASKIKSEILNGADIPKDVFVFLIVVLVGFSSFFLGRLSNMEHERKTELRLLHAVSGTTTGQNFKIERVTFPETQVASQQAQKQLDNGATATKDTVVPGVYGEYVAAKSGKAYYLPWCGGVKLIKEENKIWFSSKEEAEAKGYRPAANCKGI